MIRLRETLLPLAEKFHRMGGDAIEGIRRQRQMPSSEVERAVPREVRLVFVEQGNQRAIEQASDALGGTLFGFANCERTRMGSLLKMP